MVRACLLILMFLCNVLPGYCQEGFRITNDRRSVKIKFDLVNNAIIVPVTLNGVELSFLLDTGVSTGVLLNIDPGDSLQLKDAEKIYIRGFGGKEYVVAYRSENNRMRIGKTISNDLTLFLIYDKELNFSPRLGVPVHGILGSVFFEDLIVRINYNRKFLRVYNPRKLGRKWANYSELPIRLYKNKPYMDAQVEIGGRTIPITLMVDSGLGDALWLFGDNPNLKVPEKSFEDFLGMGLMGVVTGHRAKIESLRLGEHELEEVAVAFPDSLSLLGLNITEGRDGSLGGEILRRFHVVLDYEQNKMFLRKNRHFNDHFHYDMSGITLEHSGFVVVASYENILDERTEREEGVKVENVIRVRKKFELKPSFRIASIREDSPAARAGLKVGDVIESVNGRDDQKYDLDELQSLFSSKEGKQMVLKITRGIESMVVRFQLEKMF